MKWGMNTASSFSSSVADFVREDGNWKPSCLMGAGYDIAFELKKEKKRKS